MSAVNEKIPQHRPIDETLAHSHRSVCSTLAPEIS